MTTLMRGGSTATAGTYPRASDGQPPPHASEGLVELPGVEPPQPGDEPAQPNPLSKVRGPLAEAHRISRGCLRLGGRPPMGGAGRGTLEEIVEGCFELGLEARMELLVVLEGLAPQPPARGLRERTRPPQQLAVAGRPDPQLAEAEGREVDTAVGADQRDDAARHGIQHRSGLSLLERGEQEVVAALQELPVLGAGGVQPAVIGDPRPEAGIELIEPLPIVRVGGRAGDVQVRPELSEVDVLGKSGDDVEPLAQADLGCAVENLCLARRIRRSLDPDVDAVVDEANLFPRDAVVRIAVEGAPVAKEQYRVGRVEVAAPLIDIVEVEGVQRRRRKLLPHDEVQEQLVVLRRMHIYGDEDAPLGRASLEDRSEVALNPDEHVEGTAGQAPGLRRVDEGDLSALGEGRVEC